MSLVATLICHPANPALDSTVLDGARAARFLSDLVEMIEVPGLSMR